jgi:hypothetical protein
MTLRADDDTVGHSPPPDPLRCLHCGNGETLEITSIDALDAGSPNAGSPFMVAVTFTCTRCGVPCTCDADVSEVARVLNRPGNTAGVLAFGGHYIHCGQPMTAVGTELRSVNGSYSDRLVPEALSVYLATRVLRCRCGFQMEIPDRRARARS